MTLPLFKLVASLPLLLADFTPRPSHSLGPSIAPSAKPATSSTTSTATPGPGGREFTCGTLSYDGHDGTAMALPNRTAMEAGVKILAAAPGTVLGTCDGIADFVPFEPGKEFGNSVLVGNGQGWQTRYCHMKQGCVVVQKGQQVTLGTPPGVIGQSGNADFPLLHQTVRHNGQAVDPFAPDQSTCGAPTSPGLLSTLLPYEPGGCLAADFTT